MLCLVAQLSEPGETGTAASHIHAEIVRLPWGWQCRAQDVKWQEARCRWAQGQKSQLKCVQKQSGKWSKLKLKDTDSIITADLFGSLGGSI